MDIDDKLFYRADGNTISACHRETECGEIFGILIRALQTRPDVMHRLRGASSYAVEDIATGGTS